MTALFGGFLCLTNNLPLIINVHICYLWMRLTVPPRGYWKCRKNEKYHTISCCLHSFNICQRACFHSMYIWMGIISGLETMQNSYYTQWKVQPCCIILQLYALKQWAKCVDKAPRQISACSQGQSSLSYNYSNCFRIQPRITWWRLASFSWKRISRQVGLDLCQAYCNVWHSLYFGCSQRFQELKLLFSKCNTEIMRK